MAATESLDFQSFIVALPAETRSLLYQSTWTCQALFRALGPLAQQYVLRLLYVNTPVEQAHIQVWDKAADKQRRATAGDAALQELQHLSIIVAAKTGDGRPAYRLQPDFQKCIRLALSGGSQQSAAVPSYVLSRLPSPEQMAGHAAAQWEGILLYLLEPNQEPPRQPPGLKQPPLDVPQLVATAGLVDKNGYLTPRGYRFLLQDTHTQIWTLLREYIRTAEQGAGGELAGALSFLMQLGFRQVGRPYPMEGLGAQEQRIAAHMAQLGLLTTYIAPNKAVYFCPTPLAASLCGGYMPGGGGAGQLEADKGGGIIVETNFRIYASTTSPIQVRLLQELCRMECCLPNLFVGTLSREVFLAALSKGIKADHVIAFLQQQAHPRVANKTPIVPENVMDQLRLWEQETMRIIPYDAYVYDNFDSSELYERTLAYAQQLGAVLWVSATSGVQAFACDRRVHQQIKQHVGHLKLQLEQERLML